MTLSNSPKSSPQPSLEASISQLSLHSSQSGVNEDWDQSMRVDREPARASIPPPPPPPNGTQSQNHVSDSEATPNEKFGTRGKRSLGEMLKRHVEKGRSLNLSDEDEEKLSEELGKWINADSSPYELDDPFFPPEKNDNLRSRAGSTVNTTQDAKTTCPSATSA